jgi:Alginate lyase
MTWTGRFRLFLSAACFLFPSFHAHAEVLAYAPDAIYQPDASQEQVLGDSTCQIIAAPPESLATPSKYEQSDVTRSAPSQDAMDLRNSVMKPIRQSIVALAEAGPRADADLRAQLEHARCVIRNIRSWAESGSLTRMKSPDAFLSRDRLMSEIILTLIAAEKVEKMNSVDRKITAKWLAGIADSTIEYYRYRAGRSSKLNNHRYWAALAVGSVGFVLDQPQYKDWAARSFTLGVCQVDAAGYLPLELARGELALEYHVYSLRPLQALANLARSQGEDLDDECNGGLRRLRQQTLSSLRDTAPIDELTGLKQTVRIKEMSYIGPLRLSSLGLM